MYGPNGAARSGYDCAVIPGAVRKTDNDELLAFTRICGSAKGLVTTDANNGNVQQDMYICCEYRHYFPC